MLNQLVEQHVEEHPLLIGKEKPFAINAGFTPYAMDYFVGDRINHSQWGKGMVIASGIVEGRTAYEQARREGLARILAGVGQLIEVREFSEIVNYDSCRYLTEFTH